MEVHEEDIHEVLVLDIFTSDGLKVLLGSLESLDVEVHRLGGIMDGGVEVSEGINPSGHVGGLELGYEGSPELIGGGVALEEGPVLGINPEVDSNSCLAVILLPYCFILCLVLCVSPKHNTTQTLHCQQHLHLCLPVKPVGGGEDRDLGEELIEETVGGHAEGIEGPRNEVEQWIVVVVGRKEVGDQKSKKTDKGREN